MTISRLFAAAVLAGLLLAPGSPGRGATPGPSDWRTAAPGFAWSFPEDHWSHPGFRTEWWYLTGHLTPEGATEPRFGYQFTIFRIGLFRDPPDPRSSWSANALVMGHASISDLATGRHVFSDVLYRAVPLLGGFGRYPDPLLAWCRGPAGTDRSWTIRWNGEAFDLSMADEHRGLAFTLGTAPAKPRIFQGPQGYSRKGRSPDAASLYYSFTRLETRGEITLDGETFLVRGTSWMDKEFGSNQLEENQVGWDWFSLQLDDDREVMLYLLRNRDGALDFGRGTVVEPDGAARYLDPGSWSVEALATWRSPESGIQYPSGWRIRIPGDNLDLQVRPLMPDQENLSNRSSGIGYWEGAVEVLGGEGVRGRGYVELTGYGARNRPWL